MRLDEAADEIERLRKELNTAGMALLLAANRLENLGSLDCDAGDAYDAADAARIALKEKEPSKWKCPMGYASCNKLVNMDREDFYKLVNPVRMLICNKMYDHAYEKILELEKIGIYFTVNDDGYNEWLKEKK
jgi:hypothetical protein